MVLTIVSASVAGAGARLGTAEGAMTREAEAGAEGLEVAEGWVLSFRHPTTS